MWAFALFGTMFFTLGTASFLVPVDGFVTPTTTTSEVAVWICLSSAFAILGFAYLSFENRGRFQIISVFWLMTFVSVVLGIAYSGIAELRLLVCLGIVLFSVCWSWRTVVWQDSAA